MKEADIERAISDYLQIQQNMGKLVWFRMNSGKAWVGGEKKYLIQLCQEGTPDILVIQYGRPIFFEVKSDTGKVSTAQEILMELLENQGALCYVVRSVDEVIALLEINIG
uniref:Putative VRR-NUC domain-containing protein n=1 Tax=viral metagenome TaxID=1070528 RepID=A0A6H2A3U8_9ZZZZ